MALDFTLDDAYARALDEPAFSNGTMWDIWSGSNCYRCANDGMGTGKDDPQCPLIAVALATQRHLVVTVNDQTGLTAEHIETARTWLRQLAGEAAPA